MADSEGTDLDVGRQSLADVLGVSIQHLHKMVRRGMPQVRRGVYRLPDCVQWYIEDLKTRGAIDAEEAEEVVRERTLLYRAQRQGKELDNAQVEGRLAPVDWMEERVLELAAELVGGTDQFPPRAAPDCVGLADETEAVTVLERHMRELRDGIATRIEALAEKPVPGAGAADADT